MSNSKKNVQVSQNKAMRTILSMVTDIESTNSKTDSTNIESTEAGASVESDGLKYKNLSTSSEKANSSSISTDWNELIDDEEIKYTGDTRIETIKEDIYDWLPAFSINKEEFDALITCTETEGIIYLREDNLQQVYKEMENNINEYFKNKLRKPDLSYKWEPGHICTIHYKGSYYRGKIYKVAPETITAVMIDFGSDHPVERKDLYREILYPKIPAFASKVKLAGVYAKSGAWLSSDFETLMDIIIEHGKIVIKGPLDVDVPLAEVFTNSGVNINQVLVQKCPNLTRCKNLEESFDDDVIEKEESAVHDAEIGEIGEKPTTKVDTTNSFKFEPLPENCMEKKFQMRVAWVITDNIVAIRNPTSNPEEGLFLDLTEQITECWEDQPVLDKISIGMPCIAPYSKDSLWYRAKVYNTDGLDCGFVFIIFVDFGNVESVNAKDLRQMMPEWFNLPVPCRIASIDKTASKMHGKDKWIKVISKEPLRIHVFDGQVLFFLRTLKDQDLLKK